MTFSFRHFSRSLLAITITLAAVPLSVFTFEIIVPPSTEHRHRTLGQGFFIPKEDLLSSELTARGSSIFKSIPSSCVIETHIGVDRKDDSFYSSTKALYSSISTDTNIDLTLKGDYTMGASLRAVSNNLVSTNGKISGTSLQLYAATYDYSLSKDCINSLKFTKPFLKSFMKLPRKISKPWRDSSWHSYQVFLKAYGSHMVNTVLAGSSVYQYAFAESEHAYSQHNFTVKACASLTGAANKSESLGLSACRGISQLEINRVEKLNIIQKLVVRGGSAETRADLINVRSPALIKKFLVEAVTSPNPVVFKYIPLWDILQARFIGTTFMAQARNLEEYFKGYLDYGCPYQTAGSGTIVQAFVHSPDHTYDFPSYRCILGPPGCHSDDDCHYRAAFWCACGGPSCIRYKDSSLNSGNDKTEAYVYNPGTSYWGWHGCKLSGLSCFCSSPSTTSTVTWQDDTEHVLRNAHSTITEAMHRDEARIRSLEKRCNAAHKPSAIDM